jgi:hypothetical protein
VPPAYGLPHAMIDPSAAWGDPYSGGAGAPSGTGYTKIYSTGFAFATLKTDGSITAWGDSDSGGAGAPSGTGRHFQLNKSWYSQYQRVHLHLQNLSHPTP